MQQSVKTELVINLKTAKALVLDDPVVIAAASGPGNRAVRLRSAREV